MTATGIACRRCGARSVLIEAHTIRGVSGVACERCTTCGALEVISRRAPSAEDEEHIMRDHERKPHTITDARCEDCDLPLAQPGLRCADCRRQRQGRRRTPIPVERVGKFYAGLCRTATCRVQVTWASRNAPRLYCEKCMKVRRKAHLKTHHERQRAARQRGAA